MNSPIPEQQLSDWTRKQVVNALHEQGWTVRALARKFDVTPGMLCGAFFYNYERAQKIIADAIGLAPRSIWPSRYDETGVCLKRPPGRPRKNKTAA